MTKKASAKPTNKERDNAIGHLFQRLQQAEAMIQAQMEVFDEYIKFRNNAPKFNAYLEKKMEKQIAEHKLQEENGTAVEKDTKHKGQRAEGIRTPA